MRTSATRVKQTRPDHVTLRRVFGRFGKLLWNTIDMRLSSISHWLTATESKITVTLNAHKVEHQNCNEDVGNAKFNKPVKDNLIIAGERLRRKSLLQECIRKHHRFTFPNLRQTRQPTFQQREDDLICFIKMSRFSCEPRMCSISVIKCALIIPQRGTGTLTPRHSAPAHQTIFLFQIINFYGCFSL